MSTRSYYKIWVLIALLSAPAPAEIWQMKQRDMHNTGRADYRVPASRQNDTFFDDIAWQTVTTGAFIGSGFIFFDGAGPDGADIAVCTNTWPNRASGLDRHTGKLFWQQTPGGGDTIGRITPAFSNDGSVLYAVNDALSNPPRACIAWNTIPGPAGGVWDNRTDTNPNKLALLSPTVAPDGRIFLHGWSDTAYAAADTGTALTQVWASSPSASLGACYSDPALYEDQDTLIVVQTGRNGRIAAFHGQSGQELWTDKMPAGTDASVTIDPNNGNCYLNVGLYDHIYVVGLNIDGTPLWSAVGLPVHTYVQGENLPERAQSTGCLSCDGQTYYFQTIGTQSNGKLYAVNTADGSLKWAYESNSNSPDGEIWASSPIVTPNGILVVGTNLTGRYLALRDDGDHAQLLDTLTVDPSPFEPYPTRALASIVIAADGLMYIPYRTAWTVPNADGQTPTGEIKYCLTAFNLSGCDPLPSDLNDDCRINLADLSILAADWLTCTLQPQSRCLEELGK